MSESRSPARIETHAHTSIVSPCGQLSPPELVEGYLAAGYDGIIVTDHLVSSLPIFRRVRRWRDRVEAFFSGYRAVAKAAGGTSLSVYPACELTFAELPGYDFLVFGIDEAILASMGNVCEMTLSAFRSLADEAGALVFQAHPFRGVGPADPSFLDGVEIYNGNRRQNSNDSEAEAFAGRHELLQSSGSDAHLWEDVGIGGILVPGRPTSVLELVRWYREMPEQIHPFHLDALE